MVEQIEPISPIDACRLFLWSKPGELWTNLDRALAAVLKKPEENLRVYLILKSVGTICDMNSELDKLGWPMVMAQVLLEEAEKELFN